MSLLLLLNQPPPYHQTLMKTAHANVDDQPAVAVVVACMACEIVTEQVISLAFKKRKIEDLEGPVTSLVSGNSLTNDRNRKLYVALTNDQIHGQPFWQNFKECAALRNDAVHSGARISAEEARQACQTVLQVLDHLETTRRRLQKALESATE